MSALTEELPKKVIQDWRNFAASPSFQAGIDWLRHNKAPKTSGAATDTELVKAAIGFGAYMQALTDVEDALTFCKKGPAQEFQ